VATRVAIDSIKRVKLFDVTKVLFGINAGFLGDDTVQSGRGSFALGVVSAWQCPFAREWLMGALYEKCLKDAVEI